VPILVVVLACQICGQTPVARTEKKPKSDPQHGRKQVVRMLADRPAMAACIARDGKKRVLVPADAVWKWVANAYGTRVLGQVVKWESRDLDKLSHYLADHTIPTRNKPGLIRIRSRFSSRPGGKLRDAKFDELWAACVFELINIRNAEGFMKVYHEALAGKVSLDSWVRRNTKLEHGALIELKTFYFKTWKPWAVKNKLRISTAPWRTMVPEDYDKWIARYERMKHNPYQYWQKYYKRHIVPYVKARKRK
jgi:hypothetical protein